MDAATKTRDELIASHELMAWRLAHDYVSPGVDIDDLAQVGRIALWRATETFDPTRGTKFITHAWMRARGDVRNARRKHFMQNRLFEIPKNPDDVDVIDTQDWDAADRRDRRETILESLALLSQQEREIIHLRIYEGCALREVGKRLDMSPEKVRQIEHIARRIVRAFVNAEME